MSGIGFSELIILFLIGLIVLGPEKLPRVASQLGSWLGQARRMTRMMKRQLEDELDLDKELRINPVPPVATPTPPARKQEPEKKDDTYSPAHGPDEIGTGVGEDDKYADVVTVSDDTEAAEPAEAEKPAEPESSVPAKEQVS